MNALRSALAHLSADDLPAIEKEMRSIVEADQPFVREEVSRDEAVRRLQGQDFKIEIVRDLEVDDPGEVTSGDTVTLYRNDGWVDLCLGPHVPSTGRLRALKLTAISGAYWRGDEKNAMLQRIYGTAWLTKDDLDQYLWRLEEAKKRDHRKLGKELGLFSTHPWAPGSAFWLPKGAVLWNLLSQSMRELLLSEGYVEGAVIECPWHGGRFDIASGAATCLPAAEPIATYAVAVVGDDVCIGD